MASTRKSNFELLRIISMVMIILHHFAIHPEWNLESGFTLSRYTIQLLSLGGKIGVTIFVMISAYFLVDSTFKWSKVKDIWLQVLFYSLSFLVIFGITDIIEISDKNILRSLFPITQKLYWFASTYIVMYLFTPYLNNFIVNLEQNSYTKLIILSTVIVTIIPTLTSESFMSNQFVWFIYIYLLTGYYKKYNEKLKIFNNSFLWLTLCLLFLFISVIIFDFLAINISYFQGIETILADQYSLIGLLIAIFIFNIFHKFKIGSINLINNISSTMFGVYLFHDNVFIRETVGKIIISLNVYNSPIKIVFLAIVILILTVVIGFVCEKIRKTTFKFFKISN